MTPLLYAVALASAAPVAAPPVTAPPLSGGAPLVGIVLVGDAGDGGSDQEEVALSLASYCAAFRCDVIALLGDNAYPAGVRSTEDPQWLSKVEGPYDRTALPIRPVVGNHDTYGSVRAQLRHTSDAWLFPAREYSYTVGADLVRVHVIDTNRPSRRQAARLRAGLEASTAAWNLVVGHHPLESGGAHGGSRRLARRFGDVLALADVYACGHDHHLEVLHPADGPTLIVSGGGGAHLREVTPTPDTTFAESTHGFAVLELTPQGGTLKVVSAEKQIRYTERLPAPPSRSASPGER